MSDAANGVLFDFFGEGHLVQTAWPRAGSGNAWLALDRNGNGVIDSAKELFGNITDQPTTAGEERNGFAALAVFDDPAQGGNGDGIMDQRDAIYSSLLLWIDSNHDGISQTTELHSLPSLGVAAINLRYTVSRKVDRYGNVFRFRSFITDLRGAQDGRIAYDVFLTTETP